MITRPATNPFITAPDTLADGAYGTREALGRTRDVKCPVCHSGTMHVVRTTIRILPLREDAQTGDQTEGLGSFSEGATVDCLACGVSYAGEQWARLRRALGVS